MTTFTMKCDIKPNIYNHLFNEHIKYDHSITVNRRDICSSRWQWVESYIVIHDEVRSGVFKIIGADSSCEGIFGDKVTFYCIDIAIVGDFQSIITCEVDMPYYMSSSCELVKIWNE